MYDDKLTIDVPCPGCGNQIKSKINDAVQNTSTKCESCGATIQIDGSKLVEDELDKLVKNLFK